MKIENFKVQEWLQANQIYLILFYFMINQFSKKNSKNIHPFPFIFPETFHIHLTYKIPMPKTLSTAIKYMQIDLNKKKKNKLNFTKYIYLEH